ncbi:DUF5998 family protein [Propionibacteriaceae bacterium Y2011]|uniref:DUF5998 family protein n=1 Tax=Microlunatus sp. Y2014 TaxID=3418488 RepID=UPI003B44EE5A
MRSLEALRADIETCGYFPDLVLDAVLLGVDGEEVVDHVVHHEPTFSRDQIHRHVTILVLTPTRMLVGHTDDHPSPEGEPPRQQAATSTESVPLRSIDTVTVTRVVGDPAKYDQEQVVEAWLTVNWGAVRRIDLEPADCPDPQCEADHGLTGAMVGDDLVVRMSTAADGMDSVKRLVRFGTKLQRATA